MQSKLVEVTPELAAEWLANNPSNRNIRAKVVDMYARDMSSGNWYVTGESIKIAKSGALLDGQHRLTAVVKSGATVSMYVTSGLDESVQGVMDTGIRRQTGDNLHMRGELNAATLAATVRLAINHDRGITIGRSAAPISNAEIYEWLDCNPEIREAVAIAVRHSSKVLCPASLVAFASWLIWKSVGNWYDLEEFWQAASEKVGLRQGDPVIALTNRFAMDRSQRRKIPSPAIVSAIIRAWNLRRAGKTMTQVKYESQASGGLIAIPEVTK